MTSAHEDFYDIVNVAIAYTWALDTKNFDALNDIFASDATGMLNGVHCESRDAIIARISGSLLRLDFTQHLVGNHQVNATGDTATHRCQLHAQHVKNRNRGLRQLHYWRLLRRCFCAHLQRLAYSTSHHATHLAIRQRQCCEEVKTCQTKA